MNIALYYEVNVFENDNKIEGKTTRKTIFEEKYEKMTDKNKQTRKECTYLIKFLINNL